MSKTLEQLAVDVGYASTKVIECTTASLESAKSHKFSSVAVQIPEFDVRPNLDIVKVDGISYVAGEDALQHSSALASPYLINNIAETAEYRALIFHAIDKASATRVKLMKISIADALYRTYQGSIVNRFCGLLNTGNRNCRVDRVKVIPQGFAAANSVKHLKPKGIETWMSIDIGHRTIIMSIWVGKKPITSRSATLSLGAHALLDRVVSAAVPDEFGRQQLTDSFMHSIATSKRTTTHKGKAISIDPTSKETFAWAQSVVKSLVTRAEHFDDLNLVFITGASADLLSPTLRAMHPHLEVVVPSRSQFAVVNGMISI